MNMKMILSAASAAALLTAAGAAHAQLGATTAMPETQNQAMPADAKDSRTGLPSVDMTRATGADAGKTSMPMGRVSGSTDQAVNSEGAMSSEANMSAGQMGSANMQANAATESGTMASATGGMSTTLVTNGPIPDTEENREKYGEPMSRAGKATAPTGN